MGKASLFGHILEIQLRIMIENTKHYILLFNNSSILGVMIENTKHYILFYSITFQF